MKNFLAPFLLLCNFYICYSQITSEDRLGTWYFYDGTHKVSNKFTIISGLRFNFFEVVDNFNVFLVYTGLSYHIDSRITVTTGYGYLDIDRTFANGDDKPLFENRLYEQINYTHNLTELPISHRLRFESQFLNYVDKNEQKNRIRYRIDTTIALNKQLFIKINEEIFANLKEDVFSENRFYTALGTNISKSNNIQLGYLNQKITGLNLHRLQVGLFIKTDHGKKKI